MCSMLHEPTDELAGLRIYVREGGPVAAIEYGVGYRLVTDVISRYAELN